MHIIYLMVTTKQSARSLVDGLSVAITEHLSTEQSSPFLFKKFLMLVMGLTLGITLPGLLWFAAVSLASITDVTAIWNTNAFFAYVIAVKLFNLKWEPRRLAAVVLATSGTLAVVYGGSRSSAPDEASTQEVTHQRILPSAPLLGDLLTLVASVCAGLYQVMYKKYAALPSDPEVAAEGQYTRLPDSEAPNSNSIHGLPPSDTLVPLPFGLHPNLLTSAIGLCTFVTLWIPIPVLHYLGVQPFSFPSDFTTVFAISGIALSGVIFNAGYMTLLGLWGPIITSVGNLLTIVLVFFSDILFGGGIETVTFWSLIGSGVIISAFAVLTYDMSAGR